jgi:diguanylate cyclase (GGDEF)-like protein
MVIAVLLVIMHWPILPHDPLLLWLMSGILVSSARGGLLLAYRFAPQLRTPTWWYRWLLIGVGFSGLFWGVAGAAVFPQQTLSHAAFMAFCLAGLCAGAAAIYIMPPAAFLAFALPTTVPFIVTLLAQPETEFRAMAAMTSIFVLALFFISLRSHRTLNALLELRTENKLLHHRASHDSLVNLLNHGAFRRHLDAVVGAASQGDVGCGLIFVDLDAFKRVNDTAGHLVGDELLRRIGAQLQQASRETGVAARLGGDEFALLMHPADPGETRSLAEQIRRAVSQCEVDRDGTVHRVGASVGAAFGWGAALTPSRLLETADRACYRAKNSGRDRVEMLVIDPESTRERYPRRAEV